MRIFTGGVVPDGADAIVIQEDTRTDGDRVTFAEAPLPGRFIRPAGLDFRKGDVLVGAGHRLAARDLALLAAGDIAAAVSAARPLHRPLSPPATNCPDPANRGVLAASRHHPDTDYRP